jgi:Short C-terminal domain
VRPHAGVRPVGFRPSTPAELSKALRAGHYADAAPESGPVREGMGKMDGRSVLRWTGSIVGLAGVAFSLTLLYKSMRAVQAIGGFCASGGPYQIAHTCPKGVTGLLPLAIIGGLIFLGLFFACVGERGRPVALLAWPALFLSLGWNFLDYGLHLTSGHGINGGFLTCAVIFILMGAVPLIFLVPKLFESLTGGDGPAPPSASSPSAFGATSVRFTPPEQAPSAFAGFGSTGVKFAAGTPPPSPAPPTPTPDIASALERLASLHRRGELTDAEYDAAKRQALGPRST